MLENIAKKGKLTLGIFLPIESYKGSVPRMKNQIKLAQKAEQIGFKALWFRDVPLHVPSFGDAGQLYDPWVYMTHIMNHTKKIKLATGSLVLPLRHPIHTAKSISSFQELSNGRLILGVASGDRPIEFPAFNKDLELKSELFRENFHYIKSLENSYPSYSSNHFGEIKGDVDLLPKTNIKTPFLITGHSGQSLDWIAEHGDGWIYYPRNYTFLKQSLEKWEVSLNKKEQYWKPFFQSLYIDLLEDPSAKPSIIHLGFQLGANYLIEHLKILESFGVNHVILNLKYGSRSAEKVLDDLGKYVLPHFQ
ncbi:LLM class oxidoreductase [Aureivirga sp. CE67]|uniref:LLM class oxidoreductase n=1 Tax=Aureivirga sp. CE67 TaxID=1788983 RepID=UPI0018CA1987|nr:LLM class oxidoreductase [Aureivirga sp. CE67]